MKDSVEEPDVMEAVVRFENCKMCEVSRDVSGDCADSGTYKEDPLHERASEALGIVGFGLYLAWFYLMMTWSSGGSAAGAHVPNVELIVAFLLGEALISAAIIPFAKFLTGRKIIIVLTVASGALLLLPGVTCLLFTAEALYVATWFFAGMGAVILLSLWGFFLALLSHDRAPFFTSMSTLIAVTVLGIVKIGLKEDVFPFAWMILAIASMCIFMCWANRLWSVGRFVYPEKTRPADWVALLHTAGAMVANSFLLGFGFNFIAISTNWAMTDAVVVGLVAAAAFKVIDTMPGIGRNRYQVDVIVKIIAPVAAVCFLILPFVPLAGRCALICLMIFIAMVNETVCWTAVAEYMHVHQVQPFSNMAFGRFGDIVGLSLGVCCASALFGSSVENEVPPNLLLHVVVIALICAQAFFFRDNYTPFIEHQSMDKELDTEYVLSDEFPFQYSNIWIRQCEEFAKHHELTPRQTEVLVLLATGHSTSSIEKRLVVTNHTVKAHIYGIYQKCDVHSRKELFNRIMSLET